MSNQYKHGDTVPSDQLCKRLCELADAVTKGPQAVAREFNMRVPAELDRDADLVLSAAATRIADLEAQLAVSKEKEIAKWQTNHAQGRYIETLEAQLAAERAVPEITGDTSDGYHTFNELYEFRKVYNAALFNEWAAAGKYNVHKSWRHHDGEDCFGGGWFIVVAVLPAGQISNHYPAGDWELFAIPAYDKANVPFDGHTGHEVLERLRMLAAAPGAGGES